MSWLRGRRVSRRQAKAALIEDLRRAQIVDPEGLVTEPKVAVKASLVGVELCDADLRFADLRQANLRDADLRGARLDRADLSWATLNGALLGGVRFGRARLVEAVLHHADLTGADLSGVTGLTPAAVRGYKGAKSVRWPPNFSPSEPPLGGPVMHDISRPDGPRAS